MSNISKNIELFSKNHFNDEKGRKPVIVLVMQYHNNDSEEKSNSK